MQKIYQAAASPEKRLFISLLTRDISMIAAFLDLIDNSVNAVIETFAERMESAEDYVKIQNDHTIEPKYDIKINFSKTKIEIEDTAPGISLKTARDHVFKFGRPFDTESSSDRLSVYGLGLKRAFFKLGNRVNVVSDHVEGGFELELDVSQWSKESVPPWQFEITSRNPKRPELCGTRIEILELYPEIQKRLDDGIFEGQLRESIAKTYAFFLTKFVVICVNKKKIEPSNLIIGSNHAAKNFQENDVTCAVIAGLGIPDAGKYRDKDSGWFIFCNGRTVISADKSPLTGWNDGLPIFQPKHRPFLGIVYFVSKFADRLPWDTTKSGINEDSEIWQKTKNHMEFVGKSVIRFLDSRYTDEGTEIAQNEIKEAAKESVSAIAVSASESKTFKSPPVRTISDTTIQYKAKKEDVKKVANYFSNPFMSNSEVGRRTFFYVLHNEVGEE